MIGYRIGSLGGLGAGGRHCNLKKSSSSSFHFDEADDRRQIDLFMDDDADKNHNQVFTAPKNPIDHGKSKTKTRTSNTNRSVDSIFRGCVSSPPKSLQKTKAATSPKTPPPPPVESGPAHSSLTLWRQKWKSFWIEQRRLSTTKKYMRDREKARGEVWRYRLTQTPPTKLSRSPPTHHESSLPPKVPAMIRILKDSDSDDKSTTYVSSGGHIWAKKHETTANPNTKKKRRTNITIETNLSQLVNNDVMFVSSFSNESPPLPSTSTSSSPSVLNLNGSHRPNHRRMTTHTLKSTIDSKLIQKPLVPELRLMYQKSSPSSLDTTKTSNDLPNHAVSPSLLHTGNILRILGDYLSDDESCSEWEQKSWNAKKKSKTRPVLI